MLDETKKYLQLVVKTQKYNKLCVKICFNIQGCGCDKFREHDISW